MKRLSRWLVAVWALALLLVTLKVAGSIYNVQSMIENDREVTATREMTKALRNVTRSVLTAESSQRGYQLTGQEHYLEPFRDSDRELPGQIAKLVEISAGDPYVAERVAKLIPLARAKMAEMRSTLALRGLAGRETVYAYIAANRGNQLMEEVRTLSAEVESHQEEVLEDRSANARTGYRWAMNTSLLGGLLTLSVIAVASLLMRGELNRRQAAENQATRTADVLAVAQRDMSDTLALLDAFLDNAPIGMAFFDRDLKYLRVNETYAKANGRPADQHPGRPVPESTAPETLADLRRAINDRTPVLDRTVTNRPAAPGRTWRSSYFPVVADGRALGVGEVTKDVTEELAAERRVRESEARKSAILETALDAVISIDSRGRVIEFNPAAERIFDRTRHEMIGHDMAAMIVPSIHRDGHLRGLAHFLATGEGPVLNRRIELPALRKDGTEFPAELAITAVGSGEGTTFTAYLRDITEQKRAAEDLRASVERFRTLTDAVPQMIWNADATGAVTYFNQRWVEYTGLVAADASVGWWRKVAHPDDVEAVEEAYRRIVAGESDVFEVETRIRDSHDGEYHWFSTAIVPLRRPDGTVDQWIGSLSSIDEQKRQSEILASLVRLRTAELVSANGLLREEIDERSRAEARAMATAVELGRSNEELEKFAYVASHDLQEPLRKIQSFGDRLAKKYQPTLGDEGRDYVDRMKAAATRMRTLIDDLLAFSRVTSKGSPFGRIDLKRTVAGVLSDLETRLSQAEGEVEVGELPALTADGFQMRQLFQNLIGNALKFHKPGTPPRVTVSATEWSRLSADTEPSVPMGEGWRIIVSDNGIGFDPAYADRIFEVFQRLHGRGEYEGTGIGLAICRKIAQRHGGSITAQSRPGEGATFVVDLPSQSESPASASGD